MARMRKPKVAGGAAPPILGRCRADRRPARPVTDPSFDDRRDAAPGARLPVDRRPIQPPGHQPALDAGHTPHERRRPRRRRHARHGQGPPRARSPFFVPKAVKALDRYLRLRASASASPTLPWLWLGQKGRLGQLRHHPGHSAAAAGQAGVRSDCIRTCSANNLRPRGAWAAGMQEGEVMALAGWRSREMLSRYAKSAERERAIAAARRLAIGEGP